MPKKHRCWLKFFIKNIGVYHSNIDVSLALLGSLVKTPCTVKIPSTGCPQHSNYNKKNNAIIMVSQLKSSAGPPMPKIHSKLSAEAATETERERVREREGKNECEKKKKQNKINRNWEKCRPAVSGKVLGAHICQLFAVPPKLLSFSSHAHFVLRTTSARSFWQQKPETGCAGVPGERGKEG